MQSLKLKILNLNWGGGKIPLSGSNQISGSLIPATDNAIDIGSSTKNLKMLYTKGASLDGKTIDTDANGNMTFNGHIVDTIEEQGEGYIRYSSGIQICWGAFSGMTTTPKIITFQKPFAAWKDTTVTFAGQNGPIVTQLAGLNTTQFLASASTDIDATHTFSWQAIGRWK